RERTNGSSSTLNCRQISGRFWKSGKSFWKTGNLLPVLNHPNNLRMTIRKGVSTDVPHLFELVRELALYEKAPHEVTNTPEQMLKDGFGENPHFGVLVAEVKNKIVAMSLYYYRYST